LEFRRESGETQRVESLDIWLAAIRFANAQLSVAILRPA
jgi:hypothetical protein